MYPRILPPIVSSYTIVWILPVIQRSAQDHVNCEYVEINKNWDALQWSVMESRKTAHDRTNVCVPTRIHCWELVRREGSGGVEKGERSLPLHFCKPLSMGSTYIIWKILRFLVDCKSSWIAMGNRDGFI